MVGVLAGASSLQFGPPPLVSLPGQTSLVTVVVVVSIALVFVLLFIEYRYLNRIAYRLSAVQVDSIPASATTVPLGDNRPDRLPEMARTIETSLETGQTASIELDRARAVDVERARSALPFDDGQLFVDVEGVTVRVTLREQED